VLLKTRVEAARGASNTKQQHRPKIFVITYFSFTPARRFPAPAITHIKSSGVSVKP
jgi:hypothetical protein